MKSLRATLGALAVVILLIGTLTAAAQWRRVEPPPAADQQPQHADQEPVIRLNVELVNITCTVTDRNGALVPNLTKDDFVVKEEGKEQTIKNFARETDLPLTLGLLVDVSRSQERLIDVEKDAASQFFQQVLTPKDLAFLISFGSEAELLQDYTSSARLLRSALSDLRVNSDAGGVMPSPVPTVSQPRGTVLFDAVYLASNEKLRDQVGRKAIVLITDGVDQGSKVKLAEALRAAHLADTIVYSIYYVDPEAYRTRSGWTLGYGDGDLKKMSEDTGGRVFTVKRKNPLKSVFDELQAELRTQYTLAYTPQESPHDGSFRKVEVKTRNKDYKVRARKGYFSAADAVTDNGRK